ncbi:MAG: hypothetical protein H0Z19_09195 [Archaeoglobus sp.]|uniref:histidine kinase dimerization/phospho-acceptor domain-containing protein n=1 Tax=Archaeoglobus sp. TaxID=1872626 RepID=UPI001D62EB98|nr:histidine kinase dimerization/phospho-acceptor domain-containing protein [Archaeoglobus sp.]MBO8180632.1 hypothetical protein [Archaeoglobus sp.]
MNEEVQQLRRINNLLFNAFTLSSQIWMFKSRKEMIQFFCGIIFEDEACTAVVVSDRDGEYYQMDENVMNCKFLNYNPKVFSIVDTRYCECEKVNHRYLAVFPVLGETSVYVFLKEQDEEYIQILKEMTAVLGRALEFLEIQKENEEILRRLKSNLQHFQFLSDRLRNPLAIIQGVAELADELSPKKAFEMVKRSAEKMKEVLDSLTEAEVSSINLYEEVFSKR